MIEWVIIALVLTGILLVVGVAAILVLQKRRGVKKEPDYRAIFGAGLAFIPCGIAIAIATGNPGLIGISGLGVVYVVLGLQHKNEWKKKGK